MLRYTFEKRIGLMLFEKKIFFFAFSNEKEFCKENVRTNRRYEISGGK